MAAVTDRQLVHPHTHPLTHSPTHSPTHTLTHSPTHPLHLQTFVSQLQQSSTKLVLLYKMFLGYTSFSIWNVCINWSVIEVSVERAAGLLQLNLLKIFSQIFPASHQCHLDEYGKFPQHSQKQRASRNIMGWICCFDTVYVTED